MALQSLEISPNDVEFWFKRLDVDAELPESKINDLPYELDV